MSLKLEEKIFEETEKIVKETHTSRNRYINEAIYHYNQFRKRELLAQQLGKESMLCRDESMRVLKDIESIEGDLND